MRFSKDTWCGEESLSIVFPSLFALVVNKVALGARIWESTRDKGGDPLISQDLSMIENWKRFKIFFWSFQRKEFSLTKRI